MGKIKNDWQDVSTIYNYFSKKKKEAIARYEAFIGDGITAENNPGKSNGDLFKSGNEWAQVQSLRSKGIPVTSDERVLGSGEFMQRLIAEAEQRVKETLRLRKRVPALKEFAEIITKLQGINKDDLMLGCRSRAVARARKIFCQAVVKKAGYSGAEAARFLGVSTSAVNRLANEDELPEVVIIISC